MGFRLYFDWPRRQPSGFSLPFILMTREELPLLLITLGDVAGVGPEIVARAWPELLALCQPVVCGDAGWMQHGLDLAAASARILPISQPREIAPSPQIVPCLQA